jgi:hypothetical protein
MTRLAVALIYAVSLVPSPVWATMAEGPRPTGEPVIVNVSAGAGRQSLDPFPLSPINVVETGALAGPGAAAQIPVDPAALLPTAVGTTDLPSNPSVLAAAPANVPVEPSAETVAEPSPAEAEGSQSAQRAHEAPPIRFARRLAQLLFPSRSLPSDGDAPTAVAAPEGAVGGLLEKSAPHSAGPGPKAPASPSAPGARAAKRSFMGATFTYNLATSIMLVVQQVLLYSLAVQDQAARGFSGAQAGFHAAGLVFGLATLTGALRIPGNYLGSWLSGKTDQKNLAGASALSRMAILGTVAALFLTHHITLPLAAALYSLDWFIGGLEEVSRNTQILALVKPGTAEFKSWSTKSQFLAQLTGLFGPLFVVALAQFKGLDAAGHILAPILFGASAVMYFLIPKDSRHRVSQSAPEAPLSWAQKWRGIIQERALILPVIALALLSTILLKGPLSLNMASLLFGKTGAQLTIYSALFSGIFGAGLGLGSWIAHVQDPNKSGSRSAASWLGLSALGTAGLVATWFLGAGLPAVAAAWFFFALATAASQLLMTHRLQERVAAAGPEKKYAIGYSLTLANLAITVLRVLAGGIFFLMAGSWRAGFGIFGGALLAFALGQWLLSRRMSHER